MVSLYVKRRKTTVDPRVKRGNVLDRAGIQCTYFLRATSITLRTCEVLSCYQHEAQLRQSLREADHDYQL